MLHYRTIRALFLASACLSAVLAVAAPQKPNIVLILADDLGWMDTSYTGSPLYETPNIERLAQRGMFFSNAYAASPLCSPTRASIMTGQSPARCGITSPVCHLPKVVLKSTPHAKSKSTDRQVNVESVTRLSTEHYTLAEALKDAGYATGHFGKWHLGLAPYSPLEHGFDVDIPHWSGPGPAGRFVAPWRFPNFKPRKPKEHIEDRMGDEAVAFIEAHKDEPFFLNYWQFSVHAPFDAKASYIDAYRSRINPEDPQRSPTYAAMVRSLDDNVGKMLDVLDDLGLTDNTIVIFYSDNGGNMYDRVDGTTPTSNHPLRGGKATIYEGGIRVPAIVAWPGVVKSGARSEALVQSEDLYPTLLEMAGATRRVDQACDGVSMLPVLRGETPLRQAIYSFFPHSPAVPDWSPPSACVRQGDWKLIRIFNDAADQSHRYELYNLADDMGEWNNLAPVLPDRVREMDRLLERFLADTGAVLPVPNPAYDPKAVPTVGGWQIDEGYGKLTSNRRMKTMQLRSFTEGVALRTTEPVDLPVGRYTFKVRMESSTAEGEGHVQAGAQSVPIKTLHDRHWHEYEASLEWGEKAQHLKFSPSQKPGTTQIAWMKLVDHDGKTVKAWQFGTSRPSGRRPHKPQRAVEGWVAGKNGHLALSQTEEGLRLKVTAGDPMLMSAQNLSRPAGTYRLVFRMRSNAQGDGQLFARPTSRGYQAGTGRRFAVAHDGAWHEYRIEISLDHALNELRLDPCTRPGEQFIAWIRLEREDGTVVNDWPFMK